MGIKCKLSNTNPEKKNKRVIVIGASNSLITNGWFFSFLRQVSDYEVINLSLGACTTLYINYQLSTNYNLIKSADLILVEPIVNDISYLPNGMISESILFSAIDNMYSSFSNLSIPIVTLLIPTERRTASYFDNPVYKKHINGINKANSYVIDLHPLFFSAKDKLSSLFLNPGHIDLNLSNHLGKVVRDLIEKILFKKYVSVRHGEEILPKYEIIEANELGLSDNEDKENNMFGAKLSSIERSLLLEIPEHKALAGIMHWNNINDGSVLVKNKSGELLTEFKLKGKYLKLSSPSVNLTGELLLEPSNKAQKLLIESVMLENKDVNVTFQDKSDFYSTEIQDGLNTSLELMFYKFLHFYLNEIDKPIFKEKWFDSRDKHSDYINYKNFLLSVSRTGLTGDMLSEAIFSVDKILDNYFDA